MKARPTISLPATVILGAALIACSLVIRDGLITSAALRSAKAPSPAREQTGSMGLGSAEFSFAPAPRPLLPSDHRFDLTSSSPDLSAIFAKPVIIEGEDDLWVLDPPRGGDLIEDRPPAGR